MQNGRAALDAFFWPYELEAVEQGKPALASTSEKSGALAKDLKKLGWKFVGPTTAYAFMQAMGPINDPVEGYVVRAKVERARMNFKMPQNIL